MVRLRRAIVACAIAASGILAPDAGAVEVRVSGIEVGADSSSGIILLADSIRIDVQVRVDSLSSDVRRGLRWVPLNLSFRPPIAFAGTGDRVASIVSLGLVTSEVSRLYGVGFSLGGNIAHKTFRGIQLAGLANVAGDDAVGIQLAGLANVAGDDAYSIDVAGLANIAGDGSRGIAISALANIAGEDMGGIAASGLANIAGERLYGAQIGLLANIVGEDAHGIQANVVTNIAGEDAHGIQFAGLANIAGADLRGAQVSPLFNVAGNAARGVQAAGVANVAGGPIRGMQVAGIASIAAKGGRGLQLSLGYNRALESITAQAAGVYNRAERARVQIGLVNYANDADVTIGAVNHIPGVPVRCEVWADETGFANAGYRSGGRIVHSIVTAGYRPFDERRWQVGGGLGTFYTRGRMHYTADAVATALHEDGGWRERTVLSRLRLGASRRFSPRFAMTAGATLNVLGSPRAGGDGIAPWTLARLRSDTATFRVWPGLFAGMTF